MPRLRTDTWDPMYPPVAAPAVEEEPAELPLQFALVPRSSIRRRFAAATRPRLVAGIDIVGLFD
jgi:hypothetical protein